MNYLMMAFFTLGCIAFALSITTHIISVVRRKRTDKRFDEVMGRMFDNLEFERECTKNIEAQA